MIRTNEQLDIPTSVRDGLRARVGGWTQEWLINELPGVLSICQQRWNLDYEFVFPGGSTAIVVAAKCQGDQVVLKVLPDRSLFAHELAGWKLWSPVTMPRLVDFDSTLGVLLQQRVLPGMSMDALLDVPVSRHAADVLFALQKTPVPIGTRSLRALMDERITWTHAVVPLAGERLDHPSLAYAVKLIDELLTSEIAGVAVHGDYYPSNLLDCQGTGWLVIDPQTAYGDPCFDAGSWCYGSGRGVKASDHAAMFADRLGLPFDRIEAWAAAIAALNLVGRLASDHACEEEIATTLDFVYEHRDSARHS